MSNFDLQEYAKLLGGKTDDELQKLAEQIGRNGKTDLSDAIHAAIDAEIADRKRLGVELGQSGLHYRV